MIPLQEKISGTLLLIGLSIVFVAIHCLIYWSSLTAQDKEVISFACWFLVAYFAVCCFHLGLIAMGVYEPKEATEIEIKKIYNAHYKDLEKSQ